MSEEPGPSEAFAELAKGALRGPEPRAWRVFERAWPAVAERLAAFERSLGVPGNLLEDCGQAVLLRVWRFRTSYRGHSTAELAGWMFQICRSESARLLARLSRTPRSLPDEVDGEVRTAGDPTADPVAGADDLRALEECLAGLEDKHRSVVELLYAREPLTEREVVEVLGYSKSYVNDLRREALARLARCLARKGVE